MLQELLICDTLLLCLGVLGCVVWFSFSSLRDFTCFVLLERNDHWIQFQEWTLYMCWAIPRAYWSVGCISREEQVFIKDVTANTKIPCCWAQEGCGTVPNPKSTESLIKVGQIEAAQWAVSDREGFFWFLLSLTGPDWDLIRMPFFLPDADVQLFSCLFEPRRWPDVQFLFQSCLQPSPASCS